MAIDSKAAADSTPSQYVQQSQIELDEATVNELLATIQRAVRKTLRVNLRADDGSERNQDALELVHDAWMKLQNRLNEAKPVQSPNAYAYITARKLCFDYLRRLSGRHRSLLDSALRYLRLTPGFAAWKVDGKWLTGFARWQVDGTPIASSAAIQRLLDRKGAILDPAVKALSWPAYRRAEWQHLMLRIFSFTDAPLRLEDLRAAIFVITNIAEDREFELDPPRSPEPSVDVAVRSREQLKATWSEIVALPRHQRVALLLNSMDGDLDQLLHVGIATLEEIAVVLAITPAEIDALRHAIPALDAELNATPTSKSSEQFAALWRHVPVDDGVIGKMFGLGRQEVVNRRLAARQRLHRKLAELLGTRQPNRRREPLVRLTRRQRRNRVTDCRPRASLRTVQQRKQRMRTHPTPDKSSSFTDRLTSHRHC
ncbi:MAG TPA: sigma factor [Vicinamibacterales bacterium]|nr:sigma factor [Vicinamibacterales bacterium]